MLELLESVESVSGRMILSRQSTSASSSNGIMKSVPRNTGTAIQIDKHQLYCINI